MILNFNYRGTDLKITTGFYCWVCDFTIKGCLMTICLVNYWRFSVECFVKRSKTVNYRCSYVRLRAKVIKRRMKVWIKASFHGGQKCHKMKGKSLVAKGILWNNYNYEVASSSVIIVYPRICLLYNNTFNTPILHLLLCSVLYIQL